MTSVSTAPQPAAGLSQDNSSPVRSAFNKASRFIHGQLEAIPSLDVAHMMEKLVAKIEMTVDKALPPDSPVRLRDAAIAYGIARSRARMPVTAEDIALQLQLGLEHLETRSAQLVHQQEAVFEYIRDKQQRYLGTEKHVQRGHDNRKPLFEKTHSDRLYFRLRNKSKSPVEPVVSAYLAMLGYTVTDYKEGYARDERKNTCRIGKILEKNNPKLLQAFKEDFARYPDNMMVVICRGYDDLGLASTGRGWESCRSNSAWTAAELAVNEIHAGVMTAYLVRETDPDIHDPLGRINIKPYYADSDGKNREVAYFCFNPIGLHHPAFADAVNTFVDDTFNKGKYGAFNLSSGCESYREFERRWKLPEDAQAALDMLEFSYKFENGQLVVTQDLLLSGLGLSKLPDFSNVKIEKQVLGILPTPAKIDLSKNRLMTLEGMPDCDIYSADVSRNMLVCFAGAARKTGVALNYEDNPYLMSLHGIPEALRYIYGNGCGRSYLTSSGSKPKCPIENPEIFPSFRRPKQPKTGQ